jgi:hypothetical protein
MSLIVDTRQKFGNERLGTLMVDYAREHGLQPKKLYVY